MSDPAAAVLRRLSDGWTPSEIVDGEGVWCRNTDGLSWPEWDEEEPMTPDEIAELARGGVS